MMQTYLCGLSIKSINRVEPPQLVPLNTEEQQPYSDPVSDVRAPHPISKAEPSHPAKEAHFSHLYLQFAVTTQSS